MTEPTVPIRSEDAPPASGDAYPVSRRNRVRVDKRAVYDRERVHAILDSGLVAHVGIVEDGRPVVIPMIYARDGETLYIHGARTTRLMRVFREPAPVCVTVTHVDGIVAARSAFHSSMNYRSVVVHGTGTVIEDEEGRTRAMTLLTDHLIPGRWDELRAPFDTELKQTAVVAVEIEAASAKVRAGGPVEDEADYGTQAWGGVIPVVTGLGQPLDDGRLVEGVEVPPSIRRLLAGR